MPKTTTQANWRVDSECKVASTLGSADPGSIFVAIQLFVSDAAILTITLGGADWGEETHVVVLPCLHQSISELIHHLLSVLGCWCDSQPLLATLHRGVVDGLHVHAILGKHLIRDGRALCSIANLLNKPRVS